ncbi:hypothetical protein [Nitrospira sp. KM1]|uniref:hypothetical protein n=1 Tax=Nitrospira sp. KM1 TaxID=1936990 RepID=UPI0015633586|nr:hypothetical protein [Nitrospira sp. KM1]
MACDIRIIPVKEFLRTDISGVIDLRASRELLGDLMTVCLHKKMDRILIDSREASSNASTTDVWTLANDLGRLGVSREYRVAILNLPKDDFDRGAFLELCASNRGYQLRAFRDFEEAFKWLTSDETAEV